MFEKIVQIISEHQGVDPEIIKTETHLISDLGLNSFDVITLVTRFEDEFNIEIPDRMIKQLQTVQDVSDNLSKLL